jgi:hypothetical protein
MSKHNMENFSRHGITDDDALPVIIELDYSSGSPHSDVEDIGEFDEADDILPVNIELDFSLDD